jgi:DNA-binding HxlR family transcriptional regulator
MKLVAAEKLRYSFSSISIWWPDAAEPPEPKVPTTKGKVMSAKETVAVGQLLELLESRYAIRVLWALRDGHAQTFRLLQDSVGGITPNTLNTRIKELREAGLLTHGSDGYVVTAAGADLLKRLGDLQAFAVKWATAQAKKTK